jgi:diguanylate cyclase (GGDEF)-like protein
MQDQVRALQEQVAAAVTVQERVDALNELAWFIREVNKDRAEEMAGQAYALAISGEFIALPYERGMIQALRTLGNLHMLAGKDAQNLQESEQALALLQTSPDPVLEIEVRRNYAWSLTRRGELEQAMLQALHGLGLARDLDDAVHKAMMFDAIGVIYGEAGEYEQTLANFLHALQLYREAQDVAGEATMLNNVAYAMLMVGQYPSALEHANACLAVARQNGFEGIYTTALGTAGEIYLITGNYPDAVRMFHECFEQSERSDLQADSVYALVLLGRAYHSEGDDAHAREYIEQALERAAKIGLVTEEYKSHELLSKIHERAGDFRTALEHYKRFHSIKESIVLKPSRNIASLHVLDTLAAAKQDVERYHRETLALQQEIEQRKRTQETLHTLATQDPLTGVLNRRHFKTLAEEQLHAASPSLQLALILLDLDRFKTINDTYGHNTGDQVLQQLARILRDNLRPHDLLARLGGDEFVILLLEAPGHEATRLAERLRETVQRHPLEIDRAMIPVTISLGVVAASANSHSSLIGLMNAADQALYQAKGGGRNQTVTWNESLGSSERHETGALPDFSSDTHGL